MEAVKFDLCSVEEYLKLEESSEIRHEYVGGTVHAMAGASRQHNRISISIAAMMRERLKDGPCEVYMADVKLRIRTALSDYFYYPDAMVGCDPEDSHDLYLENPTIVFEVLSSSTETVDRREKFLAYQTVAALEHYVIVAQKEMRVEWVRRSGNHWEMVRLSRPEDVLAFPEVEVSLSLGEIYERIKFGSETG